MVIIQKGYGDVKLAGSEEVISGEITVHAEGWVAVSAFPPSPEQDLRWFPNHRVAEITWRKSVAMRPRG